jgi:hypothetical protein
VPVPGALSAADRQELEELQQALRTHETGAQLNLSSMREVNWILRLAILAVLAVVGLATLVDSEDGRPMGLYAALCGAVISGFGMYSTLRQQTAASVRILYLLLFGFLLLLCAWLASGLASARGNVLDDIDTNKWRRGMMKK